MDSASCPVTEQHWKRDTFLLMYAFPMYIDKIFLKPSLLQAKLFQPQCFLIGEVLQSLNYLHVSSVVSPVFPSLFCSEKLTAGPSTPDMASPVLS